MNELKFDLSTITSDRVSKCLGPLYKAYCLKDNFLGRHAGVFTDASSLQVTADRNLTEIKKLFADEFAPKISEANSNKSQKFTWQTPDDEDVQAADGKKPKLLFRIFHLSFIKFSKAEGSTNIDCELSWKLNNPIVYPEMAASPQRPDASSDMKEFNEYREKGHFCDVTVKVQDREFKVHKMVLSAFSGYFKSYFLGSFKEGGTTSLDLSSEGMTATILETLLQYVYGQKVSLKCFSLEELFSLALFSNKIQANGLYKLCINKIAGRATKENFKDILEFAALINQPDVLNTCKRFIHFNPEWVDEIDLATVTAEQLVQFKKISAFLKNEKLEKRFVQELKTKLDNASYAMVSGVAKTLADSGDKELKQHCKRYWKEHKDELLQNPAAKKARLELSGIE